MDETSLNAAIASGGATVEPAEDGPQASEPAITATSLDAFLPMLQQLQSVQQPLTAAPTFVPQTFQDQIQFVYTGGTYYLYLYFNNQWNSIALGGSSSSIEGLSTTISPASIEWDNILLMEFTDNVAANGITWDGTDYQFICVTAGVYVINANITWGEAPANGGVYIYIEINSQIVSSYSTGVSDGNTATTDTTIITYLNVGDTIQAYAQQTTGYDYLIDTVSLGIAKV